MALIKLLSEDTANKIAAGEVVDTPVSVIKEIIENSIDAASCFLSLEIVGGGLHSIRLTDDGSGMSREDALFCFIRHATSKLSHISDLASLTSMGFRGEALSSIAAVSHVTLLTAMDDKVGTQVEIEGGKIISSETVPRQRGTTIEIRSLFYNVPARKRFQPPTASLVASIQRLLVAIGLAYPEIGIEFISNSSKVFKWPEARGLHFLDRLERRREQIFQEGFLSSRLIVEGRENDHTIQGFLGTSTDHRPNRTGQYIFINRRPVVSPFFSSIVKETYGKRISKERYPLFVLHCELPPDSIDINIHPQKREIRFRDPLLVKRFLEKQINPVWNHQQVAHSLPSIPFAVSKKVELQLREEPPSLERFIPHQAIALFHSYLLVAQSPPLQEGLLLVDLKQVQEELILLQFKHPSGNKCQGILFPISFKTMPGEVALLESRLADLLRWGFALHRIGKEEYLIETIPPFVAEADAVEIVRKLLDVEESFIDEQGRAIVSFALRNKKRFVLQEALVLWESYKELSISKGIALVTIDEIRRLFPK